MKWIFISSLLFSMSAQAFINASPSFIDFGDVAVNRGFRSQTVWVNNQINERNNIYISGSCFGSFYTYNNCYALQPYESCTIRIEFSPRFEGYESCTINIRGERSGYATVSVRGRGVATKADEVHTPFAE